MAKYFTFLSACIFLFFTLLGPYSNSATTDHCSTPSCNPNNYDAAFFRVHFPFRLLNLKFNPSCGYNDHFTLSCGQKNETLLHLPRSGAFEIKSIDYYQQNLFITDPNNCFFQRIFDGFDLSDSPFSTASTIRRNYTYYNCTDPVARNLDDNAAYCMSGHNYTVIVLTGGPYNLTNCTVIKTIPAPGMPYGYNQNMLVHLHWNEPDCRTCVYEGGVCGFKEHPRTVGCHISKSHGLSDGGKYALILGISIPAFFIMMILIHRRSSRSETAQVQQPPGETQLVQNQAATVITGLDGPTIESYQKFVLVQNDTLLKPNTGPCPICLCEYKAQDVLRTVPDCNHYFHSDCVDEWLKLNATCPVCRIMLHEL